MRARLPDTTGFAERNGVRLHYEIYGSGPETLLFVPPWSIVHSRVYKAQIPYFSQRFRCIAYDGLGNGKSDRPEQVAAYSLESSTLNALAVLDATGTRQAIVVGLSYGGYVASVLASHHPERVKAAILAGTAGGVGPGNPHMTPQHFLTEREHHDGWDKYNRAYWLTDYPDFADHFVRNIFSEPHSTKQIEDGLEWAADTDGAILAKTVEARGLPSSLDTGEAMYRRISCPMLVIHGTDDQIQPYARGKLVAELSGGELVTLEDGGHNPLGRFPAKCNALISDFLDRRLGIAAPRLAARRGTREKKALYLSSPIGLGHGRRDIAVARELRKLHPELKKSKLAWMSDFVGFVPMPSGGAHEAFLTADYNAEMIGRVEGHPGVRDRAIFVGDAVDIVPQGFGKDLPGMRDWIPRHFDFSGYVMGEHPSAWGSRTELRHRLGYRDDERVCIVTVGGSSVGLPLIRRILQSHPIVRRHMPDLRMVVVAGPRIDPKSLIVPPGVEVHAFVPDLDRHLAACDLALVQGGLTTCMELTAANTPFLFFPLKNHFEQNFHVAHRLGRYGAGQRMDYDTATPDAIAQAMVDLLAKPVKFAPVQADGAARAAKLLAELL